MWWLSLFLMQDVMKDVRSQADRARAAMASSLEQQRNSVRAQAQTAGTRIVPWSPPAAALLPQSVMFQPWCEPIAAPELSKMIDDAAGKNGVDAKVVREVARQESAFRPCVVSPKGAEGLMQLMPGTQLDLHVGDPFDPQQSLNAGTKLLKQLLDRYNGDLSMALSAYNAGPSRVDKAGGVPEIPETQNYVSTILGRLAKSVIE